MISSMAASVPAPGSSEVVRSWDRMAIALSLSDVVSALKRAMHEATEAGDLADAAELGAMVARVDEMLEERA